MIQVKSFEEWNAGQPANKVVEWGSGSADPKDGKMHHNSVAYNSAPIEIKHMLYNQYVHTLTKPTFNP